MNFATKIALGGMAVLVSLAIVVIALETKPYEYELAGACIRVDPNILAADTESDCY